MATALKGAEKDINNATKGVDKFSQGLISAGARLKQIKNELNNFKGSEARFIALNREAAKLTDQIQKTNQRIAVLASSTRNFQAIASAVSGLTGIFTAAQGATAVFGKESEGLQRSLVKLQGSLALLQGVQAAVATVTEQSAAKTVLAEKAQAAYNFVVGNSTGALKGFRIALAATGIGLAVIAITQLVNNWDDFTDAIGLSNKKLEEQNDLRVEALKSYADEVTHVQMLKNEYDSANTSQERRKQIIGELKEISPAYFGDLTTESGLFVDLTGNVEQYIKALELKGIMEAKANKISELNVKLLEAQTASNAKTWRGAEQINKILEERRNLMSSLLEDQASINAIGGDPMATAEAKSAADSINALNEKLAKMRDEFNSISPSDSKFPVLKKQIEDLEEQIRKLTERAKEAKRNVGEIVEFDPDAPSFEKMLEDFAKSLGSDKPLELEVKVMPKRNQDAFEQTRDKLLQEDIDAAAQRLELMQGVEAEIINSVQSAYDTIFQIASQRRDENLDAELQALDKRREYELTAANLTVYDKILIEEQSRRRQAELRVKAFKADQQAAIAQAAINGALGATKTIANLGFPLALPALLAEATAVLTQIALIKAQQPPEFAEGVIDLHQPGEIKGKDSIHAKLMPGESVIRTDRTQQYKPELTAIQAGSLEDLIQVKYIEPALAVKALSETQTDSQIIKDYSERFYRQLIETKDTNHILKKIDHKLGKDKDRSLLLKLKRQF